MLLALKRAGSDVWQPKCQAATSQQVFKVTTFCMDTCFQSFSPWINRIFHHALLKFSPCFNKPLAQLFRIADWYSIHTLLRQNPHATDAVIYRI